MLASFILLSLMVGGQPQLRAQDFGLPAGAAVVEVKSLASAGHPNRVLLLWMMNPKKYPRNADMADDPYTCPEETRGSYFNGPTRVSLFDGQSKRIINTIKIIQEYSHDEDEFDVPYAMRPGYYYAVEGRPTGQREGKVRVMTLRDYNGDGKALEFALFDALACMGIETALIGYSEAQDKVIQYPIHLTIREGNQQRVDDSNWADYLFSKKPTAPGRWNYKIDYRGRNGSLDQYQVRYNPKAERFEGTLIRTLGP